jgi:valyl-tRNA synthetase
VAAERDKERHGSTRQRQTGQHGAPRDDTRQDDTGQDGCRQDSARPEHTGPEKSRQDSARKEHTGPDGATGMATTYDPCSVEERWYRYWLDGGFFDADPGGDRKPFCIVIPPPNVTGILHMGHALNNTVQDVLVRWHRMRGDNTLWLPGTDHAGIATQARVERQLAEEGLTKDDLGRERFLERVWAWKEQYGGTIIRQLKRLGASCDWRRERFTMDEGCSRAVREAFRHLYHKGLIYRGSYIVNWCPQCRTTISDIEVEHSEERGTLTYIRYPGLEGADDIVVATTRPETMLGDTAVAVHPDDPRYRRLIGRQVLLPIMNRRLPVIADAAVDPEFGTGAVKVTPGHDPADFEMGRRHGLEEITVIGKDGLMTPEAGAYAGLPAAEARRQVVAELQRLGLIVRIEDYSHSVGHCYRCETVIEPLVSEQWFVRMKPLAEPALDVVRQGRIRFFPERFTRIYLGWLENIKDWCISRQLWWGHRIPVWYCRTCSEVICPESDPDVCPRCGGTDLEQDPDVLDTWFSSALWPFSTLGWPDRTPELDYYFPTSVLVTARDIIFFWVARMIFMSCEFLHDIPFRDVLINSLVLDHLGRKMSKSFGNIKDPLEVIDSYGADTLRFTLLTGNTPGSEMRFQQERVESARNFANKVWNASRFALMNLGDFDPGPDAAEFEREPLTLADRWILSRFNWTAGEVDRNLEAYELGEAARLLYEFIWNELCDWYIELVKPRLYGEDPESRGVARHVLWYVLRHTLELLHPFMPFLTEEIWQHLSAPASGRGGPAQEVGCQGKKENKEHMIESSPTAGLQSSAQEGMPATGPASDVRRPRSIMVALWPQRRPELEDPESEAQMSLLMDVIRGIRNLRSELGLSPGKPARCVVVTGNAAARQLLESHAPYIAQLAIARPLEFAGPEQPKPRQALSSVVHACEIYIPLAGLLDLGREIARLEKEAAALEQDLNRVRGKLANESFLAKAPPEVIEKERGREADLEQKLAAVRRRLHTLTFSDE